MPSTRLAVLLGCTLSFAAIAQDAGSLPPIPDSGADAADLAEAMRRGEARRLAATEAALKAVASGDPVDAFLALDFAMELSPADAALLKAKKSVEPAAVPAALKRAQSLRAHGDERAAFELLARMRVASDDPGIDAAWREAKIINDARSERENRPEGASRAQPPDPNRPLRPQERAAPDDVRSLDDRVREMERRLDKLSISPKVEAQAEPAVDSLDRRLEELRKEFDRALAELRRETDRLRRDVDTLRRDVERVRSRP